MRKILIVLLTIPSLFVVIFGIALFDYIYYPIISFKAENAAEAYLEEKYSVDFLINESTYSKPLGDDFGDYHIVAHPKKKES